VYKIVGKNQFSFIEVNNKYSLYDKKLHYKFIGNNIIKMVIEHKGFKIFKLTYGAIDYIENNEQCSKKLYK
jgi:hypothetical protein